MLAALAKGHTNRECCYVGNQDERTSADYLQEQNSLRWQVVTWGCVYVNTSPLIPYLVTRVFSAPTTTLLSKGSVLLIVEACLSLLTYQTEALILSAADELIRLYPQEKPGRRPPQASHAWRTEEPLSHPGGSDAGEKHTWSHRLSMATGPLVRPDNDDPSSGRGLSHDKRVFLKGNTATTTPRQHCLLLW